MTKEKLAEILEQHRLWLNEEIDKKADLSGVDLSEVDLNGANLSRADLRWTSLRRANLGWANLSRADLSMANLSEANLSRADLSGANLSGANLSGANLSGANLSGANLSGARGLISTVNFLETNFERTNEGYIVYKCFNGTYSALPKWKIEKGSVIEENVNFNRTDVCGCGINVAPLDWVKRNYRDVTIWKLLIRWEWLCGVCVPYMSDGKIRCEKAELLEKEET